MPTNEITKDWKLVLNSVSESSSLACPKCSEGRIFDSYSKIKLADKCENCGLDLSSFDVGDGPAYVAGFIICFVVPILAVITEIYFKPSLLIHAVLWTVATIALTYLILIYSRASFMHLEYKIKKLEKIRSKNE